MKDHPSHPCDVAIKEVTRLSKATLNNLRGKVQSGRKSEALLITNFRRDQMEFVTVLRVENVHK